MLDDHEHDLPRRTEPQAEPAVPPTIATRLWFGWFALVAVVLTVPLSLIQLIAHQFAPSARTFKRWAGLWGRSVLLGSGVRVDVEEQVRLDPSEPCVFAVNHQNTLDILALAGYLPVPFGFVAKAELARVPFLGFAIRNSASLFIDRSEPRRSLASIQEAGRRIREGTSVLIFAEGARSYSASLLPFRKGAFILAVEAGVPLVPVTLVDAYRLMDERYHAARPGRLRLVIGKPIPMAGKRRRDLPEIMARVRASMEEVLAEEQPVPHAVEGREA